MPLTKWGKKRELLKKAQEFLAECCIHLGLPPKSFSKSARRFIMIRAWRDEDALRRAVYGAALCASDGDIMAGHFGPSARRDLPEYLNTQVHEMAIDEIMREKIAQFYTKLGPHEVEGVYKAVMDQVERPLVEETLTLVKGNQLRAARILGINRNTLSKKIRVYNIASRGTQ